MRTDHLHIVFEILFAIEAQIDRATIDWSQFSATALNMSEPHWARIMQMMVDDGYITGYSFSHKGDIYRYDLQGLSITLKGLAYVRDYRIA